MLNIILCDNSNKNLNCLEQTLEKIFIKHDIQANILLKTTKAKEVLDISNTIQANVFILNINLNDDINGLELAAKIRKNDKNAYIIFITEEFEHVLSAYKVKTFDYLIKPLSVKKLERTIIRLIKDIQMASKKYLNFNNNIIIDKNKINYIKRDGMKLIISTKNREYETYSSLNKVIDVLPDNFIRCHKSFIVNVDNIEDVEFNKNTISFNNNKKCYIGPKYKNNFMEIFNNENYSRVL